MMANVDANIVKSKLQTVVAAIGRQKDPFITKYACIALTKLAAKEGTCSFLLLPVSLALSHAQATCASATSSRTWCSRSCERL
jgi:hypothetical protein